jgi:Leucine-rich repeat (LRR) protein
MTSGVSPSDITTSTATIAWTTDEPATSQVEYGTTAAYGSTTTLDANLVTSHSVTLIGLTADTTYHYQVKSKDKAGNETSSVDLTLKTVASPTATLSGQPTGVVSYNTTDITVAGADVVAYKYRLDIGAWNAETPVSTHIILSGLADGLHTVSVIGKDSAGYWQTEDSATATSWTVAVPVVFPDPGLEAAIREAIGIPQGDIYQTDLVGLTGLDPRSTYIADLTGLEYCTSLTALQLYNNQIGNVSPLSSLTSLTGLGLSGNQISDIAPLSSLTSLTWLGLGNNTISDIAPLSSLTSLTWLGLWNNQISDIGPLSSLTSLNWLGLWNNQISDIAPLSSLTSLTWLELGNNTISDIAPLSSLTSLNWLYLSGNQISDIGPLSSLTSLVRLSLSGNQISDIGPFSSLTSLTRLSLSGNQISDIGPLSSLTSLSWLDLGNNTISDIAPLSSLTSLNWLGLSGNQISDIAPLVNNGWLGQGDSVDLTNNPLSDTSVNTYIPELEARGVTVVYTP